MVGKDTSFSAPVSRRKVSSAAAASISRQPALRRLGVEPGEKARQRRAVANMRGARAGEFDRVLDRLHPGDRIGLDDRLAARRFERLDQPRRRGRRVEDDARARRAARRDERNERLGRRDVGEAAETRADRARQLLRLDEQGRPAVARRIGEGERQRRMGDVAAANVEQPGDGVGVADQQPVGALQRRADALQLGRRALAGEPLGMSVDRRQRRARTVGPDRVDRIGLDRDEFAAGGAAGLRQPLDRIRRMQPRDRSRACRPAPRFASIQADGGSLTTCLTAKTEPSTCAGACSV